jgi:hypothetical protein
VHGLIKRHEVQVLRRAGHSQSDVSRITGVSLSEIRRIDAEAPIEHFDDAAERKRRGLGRPSKAEPLREYLLDRLARSPNVTSLELFYDAKVAGHDGSKSAFYAMVARVRAEIVRSTGAVGSLPGDGSLHGIGAIDVRFGSGGREQVLFLVSQLTYSRWSEVSVILDRGIESLLRGLVNHFESIGGVPLIVTLDRENADAVVSRSGGTGGRWHPAFAQTMLDLGVGVDLRGRGPGERSGAAVEALIRWVKASFFRTRRFADTEDLRLRMREWCHDVNTRLEAGATGAVPATRMPAERVRLRPIAPAVRVRLADEGFDLE